MYALSGDRSRASRELHHRMPVSSVTIAHKIHARAKPNSRAAVLHLFSVPFETALTLVVLITVGRETQKVTGAE